MKSLLVPIEDHAGMTAILQTAAHTGALLQARVTAIALRAMQFQVVGAEPIVAVNFPPAAQDDEAILSRAREIVDTFKSTNPDAPIDFRDLPPVDDLALGALARVYDLTIVGRPTMSEAGPRMTTLEAVLFDGGRPILISPPQGATAFGKRVVVSWNRSLEGARTVQFAQPLLRLAERVTVLTIEEAVAPGPPGRDLVANLEANDIRADELTTTAANRKPGAAILAEAAALGADLLVKSAYTQSRLRQMIFGGATSHILAHAELPVFMAN